MTSTGSRLAALPVELLSLILAHLDQDDVVRALLLCRSLHPVVLRKLYRSPSVVGRRGHAGFFRTVFFTRPTARLAALVESFHFREIMEFFDYDGSCLAGSDIVFPRCRSLCLHDRALGLMYARPSFLLRMMHYVGRTFPALTRLEIVGVLGCVPEFYPFLDVEDGRSETGEGQDDDASRDTDGASQWALPPGVTLNLQTVRLEHGQTAEDGIHVVPILSDILGFFQATSSLQSLDLQIYDDAFKEFDIMALPAFGVALRHLRLACRYDFAHFPTRGLGAVFPNLESLELRGYRLIADPFTAPFPKLRELAVWQTLFDDNHEERPEGPDRDFAVGYALQAADRKCFPAVERMRFSYEIHHRPDLFRKFSIGPLALCRAGRMLLLFELRAWARKQSIDFEIETDVYEDDDSVSE